MNRPSVCSESALCPSFLKPLCSVVAIVTVVLVVNVALIRWPRSRKTFQQRTTGAAQVLVAFVHLLCTYSTVVLQFFTVNSITADTLWTRTGHVYYNYSMPFRGLYRQGKNSSQDYDYVFMQCKYLATVLTFRGSYENFPAVAWSPRKRSPR